MNDSEISQPSSDDSSSKTSGTEERLHLRAASENDRAFLYSVFESTRVEEFARAGLSADRIAALLAKQFSMQDAYYRSHYPQGSFDVVMLGHERVGRLYHDWRDREARLIDIALLPAYRGAGLGTKLMNAFVARAAARAVPIVLYVEMENPVQWLYRRLGFEAVGENGVYIQMRREVAPFDAVDVTPIAGLALDDARQC